MNFHDRIFLTTIILIIVMAMSGGSASEVKPNVVIIMADDLGFNDVSFHGSNQILTPNIDALAYNGVILNRFYTPPLCTPSRSSLMTGKYTNKIGMQHNVIVSDAPFALGADQKLMPQYFKEAGYNTYMVGKWHLGFYQKQYTPTMRGFDSFFGYYGGYIDYYDYSLEMLDRNYSRGYDMRKNLTSFYDIPPGTYATDLFTDEATKTIENHNYDKPLFLMVTHLAAHSANEDNPMQAPPAEVAKFSHIRDLKRRTLAAMVSKLDESVGKVVESLRKMNVLNNTIIIFYSDNGAPTQGIHSTAGSNFPFRGQKESGWEGGIRNIAIMYSSLLEKKQRVSDELIHITDILPTLARKAGFNITKEIDGRDQWDMISKGTTSNRTEILHITDPIDGFSSYVIGEWKLVNGTTFNGEHDGWLSEATQVNLSATEYFQRISASTVQMTLKNLTNLTSEVVNDLRDKATVKCPLNQTALLLNSTTCNPLELPCLFNIKDDPCERINLASQYPDILKTLQMNLQKHINMSVKPRFVSTSDPNCNPANFNNTWHWWQPDSKNAASSFYPISIFSKVAAIVSLKIFHLKFIS